MELRCPVCRARPSGVTTCRRCGIGLRPWFAAVEWARRLRESARLALLAGAPSVALRAARMSLVLHHTPRGLALLLLARAWRPKGATPAAPAVVERPR